MYTVGAGNPDETVSKAVLQCKLNDAGRVRGFYRGSKAGCANNADRKPEVCSIQCVEELCPEVELLSLINSEHLNQRQVQIDEAVSSCCVAADCAILPEHKKRIERASGGRRDTLSVVSAGKDQTVSGCWTIGQISVEVRIDRNIQSEWLTGIGLKDPGKLPAS